MEILRPLCAPHAPPPIWIGTPEVTSTRGVIPRFSIRHGIHGRSGWMDIFQGWKSSKIFFLPFLFLLRERIVIETREEWMKRVNASLVEGDVG